MKPARAALAVLTLAVAACGDSRPAQAEAPLLSPALTQRLAGARAHQFDWTVTRLDGEKTTVLFRLSGAPLGHDADGIRALESLIPHLQPDTTITILPYRDEAGRYPFDAARLRALASRHQISIVEPQPYPGARASGDGRI